MKLRVKPVVRTCAALSVALGATQALAGWSTSVTTITPQAGATTSVEGNLSSGKTMALDWAAKSSVACFPATENANFSGNHVLYGTQIPKDSTLKITAVPKSPSVDVSLYAYEVGSTKYSIPPNLGSVTSCEASYDAKNDSNPGATETVTLTATTNPYNVVIGVAGPQGVTSGAYTLKVELQSKAVVQSATLVPTLVDVVSGTPKEVTGKLERGGVVALDWAAKSSMACFPATENVNFDGNHVLYQVTLPKSSDLYVTATPTDPSLDLSVYAYQVSATSTPAVPPNVSSATSCEAGYDAKTDNNPGVAETVHLNSTTNQYNVIIGVAGAHGAKAGAFKLKIDVKPKG
jgi:hypothetical protein